MTAGPAVACRSKRVEQLLSEVRCLIRSIEPTLFLGRAKNITSGTSKDRYVESRSDEGRIHCLGVARADQKKKGTAYHAKRAIANYPTA
jgi:hypothetical protein